MDCKELRIGNWVYFKLDDEYIQFDYSMLEWDNANDIHAIPLTEEWLVKFGFVDNCKNGYEIVNHNPGYYFLDNEGGFINDCPILYVHQLQNLYFALTGEELEYV